MVDLLDILSEGGKSPSKIMRHIPKLFQAVHRLKFRVNPETNQTTNEVLGIVSRDGEEIDFLEPCVLEGKVEEWLQVLLDTIKERLKEILADAVITYAERPREEWLMDYPAQIVLVACQIYWTSDVNDAFEALEENNENAMKDYNAKQIQQLNNLIKMVQGKLDPGTRQKIMSLVTIDVHARDVVHKLVKDKVSSSQSFAWQSQLRQRWDDYEKNCIIDICDATFNYGYEYLGNGPVSGVLYSIIVIIPVHT